MFTAEPSADFWRVFRALHAGPIRSGSERLFGAPIDALCAGSSLMARRGSTTVSRGKPQILVSERDAKLETRVNAGYDALQEQRSSRCALQSRGRRVSSISRFAVSCGGCLPFKIAVTRSGARKASLKRRMDWRHIAELIEAGRNWSDGRERNDKVCKGLLMVLLMN